ncbi:phosphoribosyltransferase family protein [Paraburkholderia sp. J67]|uniref:phosphoribosyltransferase n=1 Tax=Paraburkholderia sp. J67 TaxID=2805435 RepID=UPI0039F44E85
MGDIEKPDRLILDLDPDPSLGWDRFGAAQLTRELRHALGLRAAHRAPRAAGLGRVDADQLGRTGDSEARREMDRGDAQATRRVVTARIQTVCLNQKRCFKDLLVGFIAPPLPCRKIGERSIARLRGNSAFVNLRGRCRALIPGSWVDYFASIKWSGKSMATELSRFPVYSYDYNEIETFCLAKRERLLRENIGLILGILRGGGIPALMLSQMLGIAVDFVHYDRREAKAEIRNQDVFGLIDACIGRGNKILLVDDVAGAGHTLVNCYEYLLSFVKDRALISVLVLVHHEHSRAQADYFKDCTSVHAVLPWERYVTSRQCLDEFSIAGEALPGDQRYKKILAINDPAHPLSLKDDWKVDCHLACDGDDRVVLDAIKAMGPEEIYCNIESLAIAILNQFPFIVLYKVVNQKRYRISALD